MDDDISDTLDNDEEQFILGETKELFTCTGEDENQAVALSMIQQTEMHLDILGHKLDLEIYDTEACCEAIENLALLSRHSRIRILLRNIRQVSQSGHLLIYLGKRLGSLLEFRELAMQYHSLSESFMLADNIGFMHREFKDSFKSTVNFCDGKNVKELSKLFNQLWEDSEPSPETQHLIV